MPVFFDELFLDWVNADKIVEDDEDRNKVFGGGRVGEIFFEKRAESFEDGANMIKEPLGGLSRADTDECEEFEETKLSRGLIHFVCEFKETLEDIFISCDKRLRAEDIDDDEFGNFDGA